MFLCVSTAWAPAQETASSAGETPAPPGREISLPPDQVKDTFFAYVLGIIQTGVEIDIDNAGMRSILTAFKSTLALPFDLVTRVTQHAESPQDARTIGVEFSRDVSIPIPFALLFYHPGSIVATQLVTFTVTTGTWADPNGSATAPVYVLSLSEGSILIDIDDWLEVLFRAYIEDTWIQHLVFFTWHGEWIGLLEGKGRETDRMIRAYFNFTRNTIIFPTPAPLDQTGRSFIP
jgi:hypothetical protein